MVGHSAYACPPPHPESTGVWGNRNGHSIVDIAGQSQWRGTPRRNWLWGKLDAIGLLLEVEVVPKVGVEPTQGCPHRFLRPARLPFRHFGFSYKFAVPETVLPELTPGFDAGALQNAPEHSGILSHPTGQGGPQVFKRLGRGAFEAALRGWVRGESGGLEDAVAIDGKSLRVFMARNCREGIW